MTDLGGRRLNMVTLEVEPFIIRQQNETATWYTGLCIDLLNILADSINFTYTITEPADGIWGSQLPNGTWAGMTGMLHRKEADFALASLSVAADRASVSDHTTGFYYDEMVMVTKRPDPYHVGWTFFTRPFHWFVYLMIGCSFLVVTAVLLWVDRCFGKAQASSQVAEDRKNGLFTTTSVTEVVEALFGSLTGRAVVYSGVSGSGRVLLCSWILSSMVLVTTYTGKLTSNSMVTQQPLPFNTLSDLVKRTDYRWGLRRGTIIEKILSTSTNKDYQTFYRKMLQFAADDHSVFVKGDNAAVRAKQIMAQDNYVALLSFGSFKSLKYINCELTTATERLFPLAYAVHLQKGSPYTDMFSNILMKIKEAGIVERLARKWFPEKPGCQGDETTAMPVSLQLVQTAFIVAAVGVVLGATVLVLERFMITFQRIANSPCYNDAED